MWNIILILIIIGFFMWLWEVITEYFIPIIMIVGFVVLLIYMPQVAISIGIIIGILVLITHLYNKFLERKRIRERDEARKRNKNYVMTNARRFYISEVNDVMMPLIDEIYSKDSNSENYKFKMDQLPYGRVQAFLSYFDKNVLNEQVYYYSAIPSKINDEIREYGLCITQSGIYISNQVKDQNKSYINNTSELEFKGIYSLSVSENKSSAEIRRITSSYDMKNEDVWIDYSSELDPLLINTCEMMVNMGISLSLMAGKIIDDHDIFTEMDNAEQSLRSKLNNRGYQTSTEFAGTFASETQRQAMYDETKNFMDGSRGGGYAAEYANNTADRLRGMDVESTAQKLDEHGRQVKYGADRTVNGTLIQTKYYKTPSETIGAAFEKHQALYTYTDSNGTVKMMVIEVPRDQYTKCLEIMQKRMDRGEVPGIEPGESAKNYVKQGIVTYDQAWNIASAGTIESLAVDATAGVISSRNAAGISALIIFAQSVWSGQSLEDSAKASMYVGMRVIGRGTAIYVLTKQLTRSKLANPFVKQYTKDGVYKGFAQISNPVAQFSDDIARNIASSPLAKSTVGRSLGLDALTGKALTGNTVIAVVTFGPDIFKALQGRISGNQLFKNSAAGGGALVGMTIGSCIPGLGTVVGGMVGGAVGHYVVKKVLDDYIEDDSVSMFRILKEEFLDTVTIAGLTKEEFDNVVGYTIANEKLTTLLENMYVSGEARQYARESIMNEAIVNVLRKRKTVTDDMFEEGFRSVCEETAERYVKKSVQTHTMIAVEQPDQNKSDTIRCPKCGMKLKKEAKFCNYCGSSILEKKICSVCGRESVGTAKFCTFCGASFNKNKSVEGNGIYPKMDTGIINTTDDPIAQKILADFDSSNKIAAIKYYRQATGVGLMEAKDYVESLFQE